MKNKKTDVNLSAEQLLQAQTVPAYRHPDSARTACLHLDGQAYTITGLHCGKEVKAKGENLKAKG
jgi:hypothetical protein